MANQPTALLIEDSEDIAYLVEFMIKREGLQVVRARDGREAEHAISTGPVPDLVLLDVMLPYVDGFQLMARIRAQPGWESVPVIMLTAKSQESDIVRALDAGANDYVVKPFQPFELLARLKRLLKAKTET
jgi:two-component system alkaline phosphatase synthesis response regulator PhoP